jgi:hypothetical protein
MLEPLKGTGTLTFERTGEKRTVQYNMAHAVQTWGSHGTPSVLRGEGIIITSTPPISFENGSYTLETEDGEIVSLEHANGRWERSRSE